MNIVNGKTGPWTDTNRPGWYGLNARRNLEDVLNRNLKDLDINDKIRSGTIEMPDDYLYDVVDVIEDQYTNMRITPKENFTRPGAMRAEGLDDYIANAEAEIGSRDSDGNGVLEGDEIRDWFSDATHALGETVDNDKIYTDSIEKALNQDESPGLSLRDMSAFIIAQDYGVKLLEDCYDVEAPDVGKSEQAQRAELEYNITLPTKDEFNGIIDLQNRLELLQTININPFCTLGKAKTDSGEAGKRNGIDVLNEVLKRLTETFKLDQRVEKYETRVKDHYLKDKNSETPYAYEALF